MSSNSKSSPRFVKLELALPGAQSVPPEQEQLLKSFMLQSVHLDASINEFASHGTLTFVFKNPIATPVEMRFAFPLMDGGAVITGITTEWDGQRISGRVCESEKGMKDYSDAIAKGHTASLVEHAENDLFLWRVGGIPGASTVTVTTQFCGPVTMLKKCGKKPQTEITLTLPAVVPPWYGKADVGVAALAFDTAVQAPASVGGLALAAPPFTATVCARFVTKSLQGVSVTSPTHGPPDTSSLRTSNDGCEVSFRDMFKPPAGSKAATNLQMRWVADGIVPNMACLGRVLAGAGQLNTVTAGSESIVSQDAAATVAMEAAAAALPPGPLAEDAHALLDKIKTQQRKMEQVCGVLFSEQDGKQPEGVHVTVLVDCSGSMYPKRIVKARKAVRALLTSLDPTSTFSVYLFGSSCRAILLDAAHFGTRLQPQTDDVKQTSPPPPQPSLPVHPQQMESSSANSQSSGILYMIIASGVPADISIDELKRRLSLHSGCLPQTLKSREIKQSPFRSSSLPIQEFQVQFQDDESATAYQCAIQDRPFADDRPEYGNVSVKKFVTTQVLTYIYANNIPVLSKEEMTRKFMKYFSSGTPKVEAYVDPKAPGTCTVRVLFGDYASAQRCLDGLNGLPFSEQHDIGPVKATIKQITKEQERLKRLQQQGQLQASEPTQQPNQQYVPQQLRARGPVFEASPENISAIAAVVDNVGDMGGTALFAAVQEVMRNQVPADRRHNVMILTDGEVGGGESTRVKLLLAAACPANALVGIIGIGNEVTRSTLRTVVEGGLGPQAIMFDSESDESIARIVLGSVNALITSQLRQVNWPEDKMVGSQPHIQWNSSQVCAAWALYPEAALEPAPHAAEDEDWEMVAAGDAAAVGSAPLVRWLGGASVSVTAPQCSADSPSHLPTFLITDDRAVRSMCIAAALARCRHPSCAREEATKLALRYGFVCSETDAVMIAISDHPTSDASCATFGIAIPSSFSPQQHSPQLVAMKRCRRSKYSPGRHVLHQQFVPQQQQLQHQGSFGSFGSQQQHQFLSHASFGPSHSPSYGPPSFPPFDGFHAGSASAEFASAGAASFSAPILQPLKVLGPSRDRAEAMALSIADPAKSARHYRPASPAVATACFGRNASLYSPPPTSASNPSLLDILGALERASWSLQHSAVTAFLAKHLPAAAALMTSDAHATVAVIVVLRAKFKDSKAGWRAHVKRAAQSARLTLGDSVYATLKVSLVNAMSA